MKIINSRGLIVNLNDQITVINYFTITTCPKFHSLMNCGIFILYHVKLPTWNLHKTIIYLKNPARKWILSFLARARCSCLYYWKNWVIRQYRTLSKERNLAGTSHSVCIGCGIMSLRADWHSQQDLSDGFPWCRQKLPRLHPQPLCRSGPFAKAGSRTRDKRLQGQKQRISKRNWLFKQRCGEANYARGRFSITVLKWNRGKKNSLNDLHY